MARLGQLALAALCFGTVGAFFARFTYVSNWKLNSGRSALVFKDEWFGPTFTDFATVRGAVAYLWEAVQKEQAQVIELPFDSPAGMGAGLAIVAMVGLVAIFKGLR